MTKSHAAPRQLRVKPVGISRRRLAITAVAMAALCHPALEAQAALVDDVVVMRRPIAPPHITDVPSRQPGEWREGAWTYTPDGPICSDAAPQVRSVDCVVRDHTIDASRCVGQRPATSRSTPRYDGCTTAWSTGQYGAWSSSCAMAATRTRTVRCLRTGGDAPATAQDESLCTGAKPNVSEIAEVIDSCTYTPTLTIATCQPTTPGGTAGTVATRVKACIRSDGIDVTAMNATDSRFCPASAPVACTLNYKATYSSTYGACVDGKESAPITSCTATGSDGSATSVPLAQCGEQSTNRGCIAQAIVNGDFSNNTGWTVAGPAEIAMVDGNRVAVLRPNLKAGVEVSRFTQSVSVTPGKKYMLTWDENTYAASGSSGIIVSNNVNGRYDGIAKKAIRSNVVGRTSNLISFNARTSEIGIELYADSSGVENRVEVDNVKLTQN